MVLSGNWIVATLGGDAFVEQPPLYHALAGASWKFLSPLVGDTGPMRLVSVLCGLGTLLLTARVAYVIAGARAAAVAAAVLATSPAFIIASHTMRVDAALLLFVTGAIAAAVEAYRRNRPWLLPAAGLCVAAALLSKGPVAFLFIVPAVAPFTWQWIRRGRAGLTPTWIAAHATAVLLAAAPAAAWMAALRHADESAWRAWFWDNQLGRFTGTASALGHRHRWKLDYYLVALLSGLAYWTPALAVWMRDIWRRRASRPWSDPAALSPALWGFGALCLLTASVTKREIYLAPAMPAFCIMAATALETGMPAWFRRWLAAWAAALVAAAALVSLSPVLLRAWPFHPLPIPPATAVWLADWHAEHLAALAVTAAAVALLSLRERPSGLHPAFVPAGAMALSLAALMTVCTTAVDQDKSLREPAERFAGAVPRHRQAGACAWRLTETDRGALSFHTDWRVRSIGTADELRAVLTGRHPKFDSVVSSLPPGKITELGGVECTLRASGDLGDARHPRPLHWITGAGVGK
jgi:4-amino-4-deoxy-L-arabinose transferase-like glycosyltransferase